MANSAKILEKRIEKKTAKIAVIGLGYVGLPLAHAFAEKGYRVTGIDIDNRKVQCIKSGKSYIGDLPSSALKRELKRGTLTAVADFDPLESMDVIIVCVPTPLNRVKDPDISYIVSCTSAIEKRLHSGQLISLESTTYPGTTEEVILPHLQKSGLKVGRDFFLCFSPERIDPGNEKFKTQDISKVVGGVTATCGKLASMLYGKITKHVVTVSSPRTAEMAKLLENTFRIVNIGMINELARAATSLQVNIWEAIDAAKTKPFGFMPFYPGPGIGGHCIGVDPIYLSWKARIHGADLHFIELARRVNAEMPSYVVSQAVYTLNQYAGKAISRSKVMVLGISYKKDVADTRESPALDVIEKLKALGAKVSYHDPYVSQISHHHLTLRSKPLTAANLRKQDLVIIATDHTDFDYKMIVAKSRLIYDTRNVLKNYLQKHIVRL
ncbi:MAG: nucleotide sugar dehydrogenase [Candidatus Omnitrophica bacterium]|nr:nucleotide sugar dehydrogenase [Candidatus Omnitrophota bacterium]